VPVIVPPPRPRWRRLAALAMAVLLAGGVTTYLLLRTGEKAPAHPTFERLTLLPGKETFPTISPDGRDFVYAKSEGGRSHIYLQRVGGANYRDLSGDPASDDTQPAYSPDGEHIVFRSSREGGGIFIMGATGESPRRLTNFGFNPSWSPDSKEVVFGTEGVAEPRGRSDLSQIWRVRIANDVKQQVFKGDAVQPSWSPSGARIAYWGLEWGQGSRRNIWTLAASGGKAKRVTNDDHLNWNPVWSPDGKYLYFASNRGGPMNFWRVPIDEASGNVLGEPEPLGIPAQGSAFLSFSRDGHRFTYATDEGRSNIERMELAPLTGRVPGTPTAVTAGPQAVDSFDASPDGKWIAYTTTAPQEDLFVIHPDGTAQRQLTSGGFKNRVPRWSADGSLIAFYSDRNGKFQGWSIRPDGSDLRLISTTTPLYNPVWSPDGKQLACNAGVNQDFCLLDLKKDPAERRPIPLPRRPQPLNPFSWSPDGERLVGLSGEPGVLVYSLPQRRYERVTSDQARSPTWLHDNHSVLYIGNGKIMIADVRTHSSRELFTPPSDSELRAVCASRDGRVIYTVRTTQEGDIWMGKLP
jgi:Tol biopolymer transport system component